VLCLFVFCFVISQEWRALETVTDMRGPALHHTPDVPKPHWMCLCLYASFKQYTQEHNDCNIKYLDICPWARASITSLFFTIHAFASLALVMRGFRVK